MAACPRCRRRDRISVDLTGGEVMVARPSGSWSLAGAMAKTSARTEPQVRLACGCGWAVTGYIDGQHVVEWPRAQTPETTDPPPRGVR